MIGMFWREFSFDKTMVETKSPGMAIFVILIDIQLSFMLIFTIAP